MGVRVCRAGHEASVGEDGRAADCACIVELRAQLAAARSQWAVEERCAEERKALVRTHQVCAYCDAILPKSVMPSHVTACVARPSSASGPDVAARLARAEKAVAARVATAIATEREACAEVADEYGAALIADAIRARGSR